MPLEIGVVARPGVWHSPCTGMALMALLDSTAVARDLQIGVGLASHPDILWAAVRATAMARGGLSEATPDLAFVVTAGVAMGDVTRTIRSVLGAVGIAGGATTALLTDAGPVSSGALVVCVANGDGAASGAATGSGRTLAEASENTARLVLAGWPFRLRYPRGLGLAFAPSGVGRPADDFLGAWRAFMGPKMRTACSVLSSPVLYGAPGMAPLASVGCLEASYATGLGYADGAAGESSSSRARALVHGAGEAALTALKRLQGHAPRLVLVIESAARHAALGCAAADEWGVIRGEVGDRTPCVGWLCDGIAAYGRGVRPVDDEDSLVVVAIGESLRSAEVT